jgi:hypothetical protein
MELAAIWQCAEDLPPAWYGSVEEDLKRLVEGLFARRSRVRELIGDFRRSSRQPFPNWEEAASRGS